MISRWEMFVWGRKHTHTHRLNIPLSSSWELQKVSWRRFGMILSEKPFCYSEHFPQVSERIMMIPLTSTQSCSNGMFKGYHTYVHCDTHSACPNFAPMSVVASSFCVVHLTCLPKSQMGNGNAYTQMMLNVPW